MGYKQINHAYKRGFFSVTMLRVAVVFMAAALSSISSSAFAIDALTVPTGGVVTSGAATIQSPTSGVLQINQSSDRAVINWQRFNIGSSASAEFFQPAATSMAVNRIIGAGTDPTQILGTLKSNGRIIILDPNGVVFETGSVTDVGGLLAATGDIDLTAFNNGSQQVLLSSVDTGSIINKGQISAKDGGFVALVAPSVINSGTITARLGKIALAAGKKATVDFTGDQMIQFTADGAFANTLVKNEGQVLADGGIIRMDAKTAKTVMDTVINTTGIVRANAVGIQNGKIILSGGGNGRTSASGTIAASGETTFSGDEAGIGTLTTGSGHITFSNTFLDLTGRLYGADGSLLDRTRMNGTVSLVNVYNGGSIQQGINVTGIGRTTLVKAGTYSENIDIFKRIKLWGQVTGGTVLPTLMGTVANGSVVTFSGEQADMEKMNISQAIAGSSQKSRYGVSVDGVNNVVINKNVFSDFDLSGAGVYLNNTLEATLMLNTFGHDQLGIFTNGSTLANVSANTFADSRTGIEARNMTQFLIEGNEFTNVTTGMKLYDSQTVFVHGNEMENVAQGAYASHVAGLKFRTNDLAGIGYEGFHVLDSDGVIVDRNWFGGSAQAVYIEHSNSTIVKNNVLATPADQMAKWDSATVAGHGIYLKNLSGASVSDNYIDDAFVSGVSLDGVSDTTLLHNYIADNTTGIESFGATAGYIHLTNNELENNATGILFSGGELDLRGVNTLLGGDIGILMTGADVGLTGLTLGTTVFTGQQQYYAALQEKAFYNAPKKLAIEIDGTGATFDGITATAITPQQVKEIEKKLLDFDDKKKVGQIFVGAYNEKGDHNADGHPDNGQLQNSIATVMDQTIKIAAPVVSAPVLAPITLVTETQAAPTASKSSDTGKAQKSDKDSDDEDDL